MKTRKVKLNLVEELARIENLTVDNGKKSTPKTNIPPSDDWFAVMSGQVK